MNVVPSIAPSMTQGAVRPLTRKAAMNVKVFQWPCGTLATSRSPRGERPEWRTILVVTDVSSIKTRRFARKDDFSAFSSARAAATSGRSCSAACSVFFEGDAVPIVKSPDRGSTDFQFFGRCEACADLVECQIGFSGHQIEQPPLVLLERRAAVASARLRRDATGCTPELHPADGRRGGRSSRRATSRQLSPASTKATTRVLKSVE